MPRKRILPTIEAIYDEDGVVFHCDGEPIEDMEFTWEDLTDPELVTEVAEELAEYIDSDELEDIDNPIRVVMRAIRQLRKTKIATKATEADEDLEEGDEEGDLEDEYEEDEED